MMSLELALCRDAADKYAPCRYAEQCPERRRRRHHYAGNEGPRCWKFVQLELRRGNHDVLLDGRVHA